MKAPIKPRYEEVDAQLFGIDDGLYEAVRFGGILNMNWWLEFDRPSFDNLKLVNDNVRQAFEPILRAYQNSQEVVDIVNRAVVLLQTCAWVAVNVTFPEDLWLFCQAVGTNLEHVYDQQIYENLRDAMIKANHNTEVIQRTWRRCNSDPSHPMCRRRLESEFNELRV